MGSKTLDKDTLNEVLGCITKKDSLYFIPKEEVENFENQNNEEGKGINLLISYEDYNLYLKAHHIRTFFECFIKIQPTSKEKIFPIPNKVKVNDFSKNYQQLSENNILITIQIVKPKIKTYYFLIESYNNLLRKENKELETKEEINTKYKTST